MKLTRAVALLVLLVHSGAFAASSVLDGLLAARANRLGPHVEADAGPDCRAHDEATCQLCQVRHASASPAPRHFALPRVVRGAAPARTQQSHRSSSAPSALHSRAPPIA